MSSTNTPNQASAYVNLPTPPTLYTNYPNHTNTHPLPSGQNPTDNKAPAAFDAKGTIGGAFTKDGAIGSVGEKVGGPLASDGMIGKNFNPDGAVGGSVQNALGGEKK
jgi:hypothetical protein